MTEEYLYFHAGRWHGPVSVAELRSMARAGSLAPKTPITLPGDGSALIALGDLLDPAEPTVLPNAEGSDAGWQDFLGRFQGMPEQERARTWKRLSADQKTFVASQLPQLIPSDSARHSPTSSACLGSLVGGVILLLLSIWIVAIALGPAEKKHPWREETETANVPVPEVNWFGDPDQYCSRLVYPGYASGKHKDEMGWICGTEMVEVAEPGRNGLATNVAYYASGKHETVVDQLKLILNINNEDSELRALRTEFRTMSENVLVGMLGLSADEQLAKIERGESFQEALHHLVWTGPGRLAGSAGGPPTLRPEGTHAGSAGVPPALRPGFVRESPQLFPGRRKDGLVDSASLITLVGRLAHRIAERHNGGMNRRIVFLAAALLGLAEPFQAGGQELPDAEVGRELVFRLGCAGCHTINDPAFVGLGPSGPDLRRIGSKMSPAWAYSWILAPREVRPGTTMPHFFEDGDPDEVRAIVAYLGASSEEAEYPPPPAGDPVRGGELFNSVGCSGCHLREAGAERHTSLEGELYRRAGPNLAHLGSKVNSAWLFAWLKDPKQYAPETAMPNLRLTDREAADLTAFLMTSRDPAEESLDLAPADEDAVEEGREAISLYGCYGCHRIAGFEDVPKHAGDWDTPEGFSGHGFPGLPDFGFSERELEVIQAAFGGTAADPAIVTGRRLVTRYNCRGCHQLEGRGPGVRATVDRTLLPPSLRSEGARVRPEWLAAFLRDPSDTLLRPWLTVRMPTFGFSEEELRAAAAYFLALEERELAPEPAKPFEARTLALGREAFGLLECARCHPADPEAVHAATAGPGDLAPSLVGARRRLRYEWIASWIRDPQSWLPGTRMPTYFFPTRSGTLSSPFQGAFDAPELTEPRARLAEYFESEEELEAVLNDPDRLIPALGDYIWSLGEKEPDG